MAISDGRKLEHQLGEKLTYWQKFRQLSKEGMATLLIL